MDNLKYFVFIPLGKDGLALLDSGLFGIYTDPDVWDSPCPFEKVENYTTSDSFLSFEKAVKYESLVVEAKGNMAEFGVLWNDYIS